MRGIDALWIGMVRSFQLRNQRTNEGHVICRRKPARVIPMRVEAVRIGDQEPFLVGQSVEMSEVGHGGSVAVPTVEDQHQQRRRAFRKLGGNVQKVLAVHTSDVEMFRCIICRRAPLTRHGISGGRQSDGNRDQKEGTKIFSHAA
jgi:hypothetical protein